jgi:hypothetical protein
LKRETVLKRSGEIIGVLFSSFGGYLLHAAPPQNDATGVTVGQATGIASFAALLVLLALTGIPGAAWNAKRRAVWGVVAVVAAISFVATAVSYYRSLQAFTFVYPPDGGPNSASYVRGSKWQTAAAAYRRVHPDKSDGELLSDFGGLPAITALWTRESIDRTELDLTKEYLLVVVLLATAVFSLIELAPAE